MSLLLPQTEGIPVPRPSLHSRQYWEGCRRHQLLYQRCAACSFRGLGAFTVCARCHASAPLWEESTGHGSLYSWTVVWRPPDPAFRVPYAPAVIRLDEGFSMLSAVIGCEPEALQEDLRLAVEFHPVSDEVTLPYFRPL
ncbi:MAG TPA: OB-fold domain-containing protein [Acidimicrobiales bacterium]|jgi:hypothetical protein|nr:OB-fold domain-containing protein [Acidimicrobiales bacterium]